MVKADSAAIDDFGSIDTQEGRPTISFSGIVCAYVAKVSAKVLFSDLNRLALALYCLEDLFVADKKPFVLLLDFDNSLLRARTAENFYTVLSLSSSDCLRFPEFVLV